ncbi:MAG: hypothetical protein ACREGB_02995, partial [Candidatus Saccharimonadales bacterium]
MQKLKNFRLNLALIAVAGMLLLPVTAQAATSKTSAKTPSTNTVGNGSTSQAVTQGYGSDTVLQNGMIVKLSDKDSSKVEPLTTDTVTKMQGVVVAANDATVTIGSDGNKSQVFVATFGHYDVLVSNQNGPIKAGDYITISALAGVGMKVDTTQPTVLGKATADFTG